MIPTPSLKRKDNEKWQTILILFIKILILEINFC